MKLITLFAPYLCCSVVVNTPEEVLVDEGTCHPQQDVMQEPTVNVYAAEPILTPSPVKEVFVCERPEIPQEPEQSSLEDPIVIPSLSGIRLVNSSAAVSRRHLEEVEGIQLEGVDIPGSSNALYTDLKTYWNRPIRQSDIVKIQQRILMYYRSHHRPIVDVQTPAQVSGSTTLQFIVYESRLGEVRSVGSKYFSNNRLADYIRKEKDGRIRTNSITTDLDWINRNPFRTTNLVFTPAATEGITDIELVTEDRFPWRFYTGGDNTGIAQTGHNRWFTGFNWGNVFGLDHMFTYQYTMASSYNKFWSHTIDYVAPLPWRNTVEVYGGYSEVKCDVPDSPGVTTHGYSGQASLRYEIPLPSRVSFLEEFTWGFDWKRTNSNLLNDEVIFFGNTVNITQLVAGFNCGYQTPHVKLSATIEGFYSPGEWLPDQTNADFSSLRAGATNTYVYGRAALATIFLMPLKFTFEPTFRGQMSSGRLLASEQFGLGGYDTVRGYDQNELNADNAFIANFELRTPSISFLNIFKKRPKNTTDDFRLLAFLDYAYATNHGTSIDGKNSKYLMGFGPGARYVIKRYLTARVDYGWKLNQINSDSDDWDPKLYFSLILSI